MSLLMSPKGRKNKMKKQIAGIIFGIFLISLVGAVNITAGESVTLTLPEDYVYYLVTGNTSPVDLEIEKDGLEVTITVSKYMQEESFEITFYNSKDEPVSSGSSGRRSYPIDDRVLSASGGGVGSGLGAYLEIGDTETTEDSPNIFSRITGAVIGTLGTGGTIGVFVFILAIMGLMIIIIKKK